MSSHLISCHVMSCHVISSHLVSSHLINSSYLDISHRLYESIYHQFFDFDLFFSLLPAKELVERILEAQDLARTQVTRQPLLLLLVLVLFIVIVIVLVLVLLPSQIPLHPTSPSPAPYCPTFSCPRLCLCPFSSNCSSLFDILPLSPGFSTGE